MRSLASSLFGRKGSPWSGPLGSLIREWMTDADPSGLQVATDAQAMRAAAVSSCVRLISQTVGSLPLHMYERLPNGGRTRVPPTNSLEGILKRPNAWQIPISFREQLTASLLLRGNGYAWINWSKAPDLATGNLVDRVVELIPLHPDRMEVKRETWQSPPRYWIWVDHSRKEELPAEEVFHIPGLSFDGTTGRGVIEDARESIAVALAMQRHADQFWRNDATPGVALMTTGKLLPEQAEDIAKRWDDRHARRARRTAVLSGDWKIERLAMSAEDSQFLETRKFQRAEIAGLFLVPPHMIGDVERSTSWGSGIEQQQIGFLNHTILPWLIRWEQTISRCLINLDERYFVEHKATGIVRGDLSSRYTAYATGRQWGWLSVNDIRAFENENPIEGGDTYLQPLNMAPAGPTVPPPKPAAAGDPAQEGADA